MKQYVECTFKDGGRSYCYHNDGDALSVGDKALIDGGRSDGKPKTVTVVAVDVAKPPFVTKSIIGRPDDGVDDDEG